MICEHCGGKRVVSYSPPLFGCSGCGAPVCCKDCCDAHTYGYSMEGNPSKSTSSPTDQRFEEYLDEVIEVTYDGFKITRKQTLIGYEFTLVRDAFYTGMGAGIAHQSVVAHKWSTRDPSN